MYSITPWIGGETYWPAAEEKKASPEGGTMFHQQTRTPGRRSQNRHAFRCWERRVKRGVPNNLKAEIAVLDKDGNQIEDDNGPVFRDPTDAEVRQRCVDAGMPAHYNDHQMVNWQTGEKLRGPGITTPMRKVG